VANRNSKPKTGGALTVAPKSKGFQVGTDQGTLDAQAAKYQQILDKKGANKAPKAQKRLEQINNARSALTVSPGQNPAAPTANPTPDYMQGFDDNTSRANDFMGDIFGQLKSQGQFNPGDYMQARQQASDVAMSEFNRQNQGRYAQDDAAFEQRMAEQGHDTNSERYKFEKSQRDLQRGNEIQGAQNNAFQLGQGEQAQAYGQAANTFNMPLNQLNAAQPFYGYQSQANMQQGAQNWQSGENTLDRSHQLGMQTGGFDFQKELAGLQHKYNMKLQAAAPRGGGGGGGGLSYEQQMALQNNSIDKQFYNNMVLNGLQNGQQLPQGGYGQGAAQGAAQGIATGITAGLVR
jgi:hypothetical protein